MLLCQLCGRKFKHLGSHIYHKHNLLARDYKTMFELPWKMGLVTREIKRKQRAANLKHDACRNKNFAKAGTKFQFKKGHTGQRRISEHERQTILKRILNVNRRKTILEKCPVCRMKFNHVESHLYQVHSLLKVNKREES